MTDVRNGIFGIDLGTTYSAVSYIDESGKPVVVQNMQTGNTTTPSVVHFQDDSNVIVGSLAKESAIANPDQVVSMVKREMGNRDFRRTFFDKDYDAPTISSLILDALVKDVFAETGRHVDKVVITVPAYFGMLERQATRQAGTLAGLDVVEVVPEPVAAAFAYGLASESDDKTVLVYDLGGGTFDVTLIKMTADNVDVVVTDGNHQLGGHDWDRVLFDFLCDAAVRELGDESLLEDPQFVQDLWDKTEATKKALSQTTSRRVDLRAGGGAVTVTVTRTEFERLTAHLVEQTVDITKRALATAEDKEPGITARISDVILVGGSSLMPVIGSTLTRVFGWNPQLADPHLSVARGAALYAAGAVVRDLSGGWSGIPGDTISADGSAITPTEAQVEAAIAEVSAEFGIEAENLAKIAKVQFSNALPKAVGVRLVDTSLPNWQELAAQSGTDPRSGPFRVQHLVDPQTNLPYTPTEPFVAGTVVANQDQVGIDLWEQAGGQPGSAMSENNPLPVRESSSSITGLGAYNLPAGSPIHLYFNISAEGVARLRAVEPVSGSELTVTATIALLTDEEMEHDKQLLAGLTVST